MRFEDAYKGWQNKRLTQEQAAQRLGVCERRFRLYIDRVDAAGLKGLRDKRISEVSSRKQGAHTPPAMLRIPPVMLRAVAVSRKGL